MRIRAIPMVYSRVLRALEEVSTHPFELDHNDHWNRLADSLNREFEQLGIRVGAEDLSGKSALEIAELITEKITA